MGQMGLVVEVQGLVTKTGLVVALGGTMGSGRCRPSLRPCRSAARTRGALGVLGSNSTSCMVVAKMRVWRSSSVSTETSMVKRNARPSLW